MAKSPLKKYEDGSKSKSKKYKIDLLNESQTMDNAYLRHNNTESYLTSSGCRWFTSPSVVWTTHRSDSAAEIPGKNRFYSSRTQNSTMVIKFESRWDSFVSTLNWVSHLTQRRKYFAEHTLLIYPYFPVFFSLLLIILLRKWT